MSLSVSITLLSVWKVGRVGLRGVESDECHSMLSLSPGVDKDVAIPTIKVDGMPMACGM